MARLIALYSPPEDPDAFDAHYAEVHAPIVARYPGIRDVRLSKPIGVGGREAPYHLMSEMVFDTVADLEEALASEAAAESAKDLRTFAAAGVKLFIVSDEADG